MLCLVGLAGAPTALWLRGGVPEEADIEWAYPWARDPSPPPDGERVARVESAAAELEEATAVQILASPGSLTELHDAHRAFEQSASPAEGSPSSPEQRLALAIHEVRNSVEGTPIMASLLFAVLGLCGLLGFLRFRVRFATVLTCSLLALEATAGLASLAFFDVNPVWVAGPTLLGILGFFGVLVGTNLLPDSNHRLVVAAEERLRGLPAGRRRAHVAIRVAGGLGLAAVAVVGTVASHFLAFSGTYYTAYVGTFATGLIAATVPLIAAIRLSAAEPRAS
ncbi:MAG: hypothetical protein KC619_24420 [Myxococcales bacterium]|nr:hypothetical protein [Myxococcales bacterium]